MMSGAEKMKPEQIIHDLQLNPLTVEGGNFAEIYRGAHGTSIYYLLHNGERSKWHKIKSDEIWYYHAGAPALQLMIHPDGRLEKVVIGPDTAKGQRPQNVIPGGVWQTAILLPGSNEKWGLFGAAVFPAFKYEDFIGAEDEEIELEYPHLGETIKSLMAPRKKMKYGRIILLCLIPWLVLLAWLGVNRARNSWSDSGENISHYDFYGTIINNATYYLSHERNLVDFDTTEEEFRILARKFRHPLEEITKPVRVSNMECVKSSNVSFDRRYLWINNGIAVVYQKPSGGGYKFVFDRSAKRGYYRDKVR